MGSWIFADDNPIATPPMEDPTGLEMTIARVCRSTAAWISNGAAVRLPLKEETLTDINLIQIASSHPTQVVTYAFDRNEEGQVSGADWIWVFCSPGKFFPVLIQAKVVDPYIGVVKELKKIAGHSGSGKKKKTAPKKLQFDLLNDYALANDFCPIYCFYNDSKGNPSGGPQTGCVWGQADLRTMGCAVMHSAIVAPYVRRRARLTRAEILEHGHSLACLLLARGGTGQDLVSRVATTLRGHLRVLEDGGDGEIEFRDPGDLVRGSLPTTVTRLIQGDREDVPTTLSGITFLADRPVIDIPALRELVDSSRQRE